MIPKIINNSGTIPNIEKTPVKEGAISIKIKITILRTKAKIKTPNY